MQKLPSTWKVCGTCSNWTGYQKPADPFCNYTEFENESAKCIGGGFHNCSMTPMATCNKWNQRFKKR